MTPKILIVYPNLPLMMAPAISVGIINAICKREGCEVKLFETTEYSDKYSNRHIRMSEIGANRPDKPGQVEEMFNIKPPERIIPDFINLVETYKPDLILMSVQEDVWSIAKTLLDGIKHLDIPHILGGVFITSDANLVLSSPLVKRVALHEGERTVIDAIEALKIGGDLNKIKGIWYKDRFGLIQRNPPQELCDITQIVPDFTCYAPRRWMRPMGGRLFQRAVSMETYRGCPYNCTYCNSPTSRDFSKENGIGNYLRRKSAQCIERDFLYYKELYDPDLVMFIDDSFLARPKKEMFEFCEMWKKYKVPFWFNTRIENCHPDVLAALKEAGCYRMTFSIECGNEKYRSEVLDRKIPNSEYLKYFGYINESNIPYSLNVIIGLPFETRYMVLETASLVHDSQGYDGLTVSMFQPYHGTKLRTLAVENGFVDPDYITGPEVDTSTGLLGVWVLKMPEPYLQKEDVFNLANTFSLYAHFPKDRWDEIQKSETDEKLYAELLAEYNKEFFADMQQGGVDKIKFKSCAKHDATSSYQFEVVNA